MDFSLAQLHEAIAEAIPDRECIVSGKRRLVWAEVTDRTRRLANFLLARGLGLDRERAGLERWESGQDHLAIYLHNGNEYLEGMLGAFKARLAPFNVNYRYVEEELVYLLRDARARAILFHASFAPLLEKIRAELPDLGLLIQVADRSGHPLLPGAIDYEQALAASPASRPAVEWSPDDLYILYTGGTTGMPKGVLWRQADIFVTALGGTRPDGSELGALDAIVERARKGKLRVLPAPPFMHGASHWSAFNAFHSGGTVVIQNETRRLDPEDILDTIERENVSQMLIVGDAFARPIVDQLQSKPRALPSLRVIISGGAPLNRSLKTALLERLPHVSILDAVGASETGRQGQKLTSVASAASAATFEAVPDNVILSEDLRRVLEPGSPELGWLAKSGRVPLGYLGDPAKSARTFPTIGGIRYSLPGDRARLAADGTIELHGRDSVTINSGGEKIFAEEVEHALKHHPAVYDAVVVGRPSERWGEEVVALVKLRDGCAASELELLAECAQHVARYKLPKAFLFLDEIVRSPSGKADYRWARAQATR
ncbi:MAG TPA: acyl-CoA synthetase [Candidatus Bathyarchaeia archaeon]|nr:acyl-CoA synthetase [Candidatus Bathyarchaeia archaeon]